MQYYLLQLPACSEGSVREDGVVDTGDGHLRALKLDLLLGIDGEVGAAVADKELAGHGYSLGSSDPEAADSRRESTCGMTNDPSSEEV